MGELKNPKVLRWGILAPGKIAKDFVEDLQLECEKRGPNARLHQIVAVGSRKLSRAEKFVQSCNLSNSNVSLYQGYENLVKDVNVDIIYVASPTAFHYEHARLCLEANKHVLCEKTFTVNAAQARILTEVAKKRNLFLMEAQWTRFLPISYELEKIVRDESILGVVFRVLADENMGIEPESLDILHRLVNLNLAGGVMFDLGIYTLLWIFLFLYHSVPDTERLEPEVSSMMTKYLYTGVDELTSIILRFPATDCQGIATSSYRILSRRKSDICGSSIRVQGSKAELHVYGPTYRPTKYKIIHYDSELPVEMVTREVIGRGLYYEADECARCIEAGKLESPRMPWSESIAMMECMDTVRKQNNLIYLRKPERTDFPPPPDTDPDSASDASSDSDTTSPGMLLET